MSGEEAAVLDEFLAADRLDGAAPSAERRVLLRCSSRSPISSPTPT